MYCAVHNYWVTKSVWRMPLKKGNIMNNKEYGVDFDNIIIFLTLTISFPPLIKNIDALEHHCLIYWVIWFGFMKVLPGVFVYLNGYWFNCLVNKSKWWLFTLLKGQIVFLFQVFVFLKTYLPIRLAEQTPFTYANIC